MKRHFLLPVAFFALSSSLLLAASITGTVTNKTTNKPAAGEDVTLLSMASGMDEAGSTKSDSRGRFKLEATGNGPFMVRVDHQKSSYYKNLPPGSTVADVVIYDVAANVEGISTEADVMRIEAQNGQLSVTENYFVRNSSQPAKTQQSERTYEVYLPPDAILDSSAAMGPSGMSVASSPISTGEKGHYAFGFPIRPNEGENGTRYQLAWHVNYKGSFKFTPKLRLGAENVAIMLPKSMTFKAGPSTPYQPIKDEDNAQTYLAKGVAPSQPLEFTVSGTGALPRESGADQQQGAASQGGGAGMGGAATGATASTDTRPGGGLGTPIDTPDPLQKYKWWILGGLAVTLAILSGFMLRKPANHGAMPTAMPVTPPGTLPSVHSKETPLHPAPGTSSNLITSLKDELFTLETEKIQGKVTAEEYANHKAALEVLLRRALR